MNARLHHFPVAVIGAGPVGLAAAAHLIQHGLTPIVLEAGPDIASNLESFRHVRLFSPWRYNIDRAARVLLDSSGWQAPDQEALPTAGEILDHYLKPFAALPAIAPHVKVNHKVLRITRQGIDKVKTHGRDAVPFVLRVRTPEGEQEVFAQAVIDAGHLDAAKPAGRQWLARVK
jgi:cation diffusion facilitator CzcD-associated flavoprotein CzcO